MHPIPQTEANVSFRHSYRFVSTTNVVTTISAGDLVSSCGAMGTGANLVSTIAKALRLKRIRIWTPPPSVGGSASCSVEWLSADQGVMTFQEIDSTNNPTLTAYVDTRPPNSSQAWFWRSVTNIGAGATVDLFNLQAPTGSIIQVDLEVIMNDTLFASWGIATVAVATVGQLYYGGLDGIGAGTGLFPPIGLSTIV